jgi:Holliday junction resolvasome RuvABC endonuclease subunit
MRGIEDILSEKKIKKIGNVATILTVAILAYYGTGIAVHLYQLRKLKKDTQDN